MDGHKPGRLTLGLLIGLTVGSALGWWSGWSKGKELTRVEAVRVGHARHRIVDEYGRTEFEWMPTAAPPAMNGQTGQAPK